MQRDALVDSPFHQSRELIRVAREKAEKRVQINRPSAESRLVVRQRHFADRDLAARTPCQYRRRTGGGETFNRRVGDLTVPFEIALAVLVDTTTLADTTHDLVGDTEHVEHIETEQGDMRRLDDITTGVEDNIRRLRALPRWAPEAGKCLGR